MSAEPRFLLDRLEGDHARNLFMFACYNLDDLIPGVSAMHRDARTLIFKVAVDWCLEQFGKPDQSVWYASHRCIVFKGDLGACHATAFRTRWGG